MLQRLVILTVCFSALLGGCVTSTNQGKENINEVIVNQASTLDSWWLFFDDPILDRFVSSAINSNHNDKLSENGLALPIVTNYIEYRYAQNQKKLLIKYTENQSSDDKAASRQIELLKEKIKLENKAIDISIKIAKQTNLLPEYVSQILKKNEDIPASDITPIFASDAFVIATSPKSKNIFPDMTLSSFFGISDSVYLNNNSTWSVSIGAAIRNLDLTSFGTDYQKQKALDSVYARVLNIERKIMSYANMQEQYNVLKKAAIDYEGKCTTLKEYDSCHESYKAAFAALRAEYETVKILVDLYGAIIPSVRTH